MKAQVDRSPTVLACITAYEDPEALSNCITALGRQSYPIQTILIIDNSAFPLELAQVSLPAAIIHEHFPENVGISGSFRRALEVCQAEQADFLWMFDQDSIPNADCLEALLESRRLISSAELTDIGIIAPTSLDPRTSLVVEGAMFDKFRFLGHQHQPDSLYYECTAPITSGSLISIAASRCIAFPNAALFIDGVDFEYGQMMSEKGFRNFISTNAQMWHQFGSPVEVIRAQRSFLFHRYSALRRYYMCRNHTYLEFRYAKGGYKIASILWRIKFMTFEIIKILLFDSERPCRKAASCFVGTVFGLLGYLQPYPSDSSEQEA